jgi:quercetin dioxygenase-like cupin family protein
MRAIFRFFFVTSMVSSLLVFQALAQDDYSYEGIERTILHQADLSGAPGMEVISSILVVQPGATIVAHFHNGVEAGRVLEGGMIQMPGKEPQMLQTGSPIFNLRDVMHGGWKSVSDNPITLYTVHVVDRGKPLFDGVQ